ncbi:helix-turn-helix domain-containing protein [Flavobacterium sp. MAH-1]|uniref:Helix-turn-helix domain-containing protein n=1 Tax=Flavobacterium agri TaxID=2743471 RepID=A0A7Y8Y404_9FLAO|nr:helix-turn-helix domain-containing protein [Flavobacterium agri]NUY81923.1 helix-turn-helix domain-containing protein [Flavobacterium agri]NYA71947.1 helix-turn-helix domain-containing protein [Flavobacterium agri]
MEPIPVRHLDSTKEPALSGSFGIRNVAELLNGRSMVQELHRHDHFYILVLETGSGEHEIDFVSYEVCDRSVFLMRPGQVHKIHLYPGSTGYLIQFSPALFHAQENLIRDLLRRVSHKKFCKVTSDRFGKVQEVLKHMYSEFSQRLPGFDEVIKASLNIFFIELLRQKQGEDNTAWKANGYPQEKLEKFLDLLNDEIFTRKQAGYYAKKLNLSPYRLSSITKSLLGRTPSEIINEHIVLEAKRNLLATSMQVNQIAYHLGYDDVSYFIRFFRKHTGTSPEFFRQNFR